MRQEYSYKVEQLGLLGSSILTDKDRDLVSSFDLGIQSFDPNNSRLDVEISDPDGTILETYTDIQDYRVQGVMQGSNRVNRLEVTPAQYFEGRTFPSESIVVNYKAFNNVYGKGNDLYVVGISADRTEIRMKSVDISAQDLQTKTLQLQSRFDNSNYFSEVLLETSAGQVPVINVLTEVTSQGVVASFKLYRELPESVELKSLCQVLESLGESTRFWVTRETVVFDDPVPELRGPNFAVEVGTTTVSTDYSNYLDLLSQKSTEASKGLYTAFKQASLHTSVDYSDFSSFIHFSSAVERLENARFKFEYIFSKQAELSTCGELQAPRIQKDIEGIIDNFDHYENYLYFETGRYAWPKKIDPETGLPYRPYILEDDVRIYEPWLDELFEKAEAYDLQNKDLLINTIPVAIREDLDHNEPYLIFIHMVGQHFDDLWVYAKAITDRYKGDNRPDFGISKELVKEAIEHFGIDLYESNQNLTGLFELCRPDGTYDPGLETGVQEFRRMIPEDLLDQPMLSENYTKEVYKRIYHNIPVLLKTKGTSRGLRVLLNCFGIPNDILTIKVQGGVDSTRRPFFGPEESVQVSPEFEDTFSDQTCDSPIHSLEVSGSVDKIRTESTLPLTEFRLQNSTGSFFKQNVVSRYTTVTGSSYIQRYTDDLHKVEIGFDLNEAVNRYFRENLEDFTVDTVIGDPRNRHNQYGDPWKFLRESLMSNLDVDEQFRSSAAIIRLVRYFDTTLFRIVQEFVPARSNVSVGAIVKDNILHRNRWRGVDLSWKVILETGSISGSKASASHGGAYRLAGTGTPVVNQGTVVSLDSEVVITKDSKHAIKVVSSGSREINGQLTGSHIGVTDGELNPGNDYKKAGQPTNRYGLNVWFLDLPDLPLCSSKLSQEKLCQYWRVTVRGTSSVDITSSLGVNNVPAEAELNLFTPVGETGEIVATTQWMYPSGPTFEGWFAGDTERESLRKAVSVPGPTYDEGPKYDWTASYLTGERNVLWFCTVRPDDGTQRYYYVNDLLIAWKYLPASVDPTPGRTMPTSGPENLWTSPSDVTVILGEGSQEAAVTLPAQELFGTNDAYLWVGISTSSLGTFRGVKTLCGKTGPFRKGAKVVDSQWYDNSGEWPQPSWEIDTTPESGTLPVATGGNWIIDR